MKIYVKFLIGEGKHTFKTVDYMMATNNRGYMLLDDDGDTLLYAELVKDESEFDDDGYEIDPYLHYEELKAEILRQAVEKGVNINDIVFQGDENHER